jgi:hypothetical protein
VFAATVVLACFLNQEKVEQSKQGYEKGGLIRKQEVEHKEKLPVKPFEGRGWRRTTTTSSIRAISRGEMALTPYTTSFTGDLWGGRAGVSDGKV